MFKEHLQQLVAAIDAGRGAIIMGLDGIPIEKHVRDQSLNLEAFAAEYMSLLKRTLDANRELGVGTVQELTVFADNLTAIIKAITPEYFLIFALPADGNFGRARFEMRKAVLALERELR